MKIIGLTGGTGSGKGMVSSLLVKKGAYTIDADMVAHDIILAGKPAYNEIVEYFGKSILDEGGNIIRRQLGDIVFSDSKKLALLNKCTHKYISSEIKNMISDIDETKYRMIVIDAPLLIESGLIDICNEVWAVYAKEEVRLGRIMNRDNISQEQAVMRMSSQKMWDEYASFATVVIDNSSDTENIEKQIEKLI